MQEIIMHEQRIQNKVISTTQSWNKIEVNLGINSNRSDILIKKHYFYHGVDYLAYSLRVNDASCMYCNVVQRPTVCKPTVCNSLILLQKCSVSLYSRRKYMNIIRTINLSWQSNLFSKPTDYIWRDECMVCINKFLCDWKSKLFNQTFSLQNEIMCPLIQTK